MHTNGILNSIKDLIAHVEGVIRGGRSLELPKRGMLRWIRLSIILIIGLAIGFSVEILSKYWTGIAPAQPIPFSHRFHVQTKQLNCVFCHTNADRSSTAGMPPVEKCLLCHNVIVPHFWPIQKLHGYKERNEPIKWVRVNRVPEFVHFGHQQHLNERIDCSRCHGDVAGMDRVKAVQRFDMDFCIDCHRENDGPIVCDKCHY